MFKQEEDAQEKATLEEADDLETPVILNERAVEAKQSENKAKILIEEFLPFLRARAARYTAHYNNHSREDALSVSMLALHEAIQKYDIEKGSFFPFANRVVNARIIDHIRKISKQDGNMVSLSVDDSNERSAPSSLIDIASLRNYDEEQRRARLAEEIEQLKSEMTAWGITMEALTKSSPKHKELRKTYNEVISAVIKSTEIMQTINLKRYLPVKAVSKKTGLPQKKLERARTYIVATIIIKTGDYELLSDFIQEGGRG